MVHPEPPSSPAEPAHDLVGDQQDPVAVADSTDLRQVAGRG
jgi:hypothetical protein